MSEMDKIDPRPEAVDNAPEPAMKNENTEEVHTESTASAKEEKQKVYLDEDWLIPLVR